MDELTLLQMQVALLEADRDRWKALALEWQKTSDRWQLLAQQLTSPSDDNQPNRSP